MKLQVQGTVKGGPTLSTDATLSALALSGVTLDPTFVSSTETYTATVGNSVMQTTVTATPTHSGATVAFKDGTDNALTDTVTLAVGATVIKAVVTAEDTTTTKTYMVTVTRAGTTDTPVTIEAEYASIGAGLEDLLFTLTREGDTTDALEVTVTITQAQSWLSNLEYTVTFPANSATAELTITASKFSFTPSTTDNLTATVTGDDIDGGSDTVEIISTSGPPITISYEESEYTFAENATDAAIYVLATLDPAYPRGPGPSISVPIGFSSRSGTAVSPEDFAAITWNPNFLRSDFERDVETDPLVARKAVPGFAIVPDDIYEGSESFVMTIEFAPGLSADLVQFANPDGTTCIGFSCVPEYEVTITDVGDLPVLSLSVDPPSIAEEDDEGTTSVAENVSTVTVGITNGKTFAVDKTATLTFSGTATQGTHYSVSPGDADSGTGGHQVVLPKETASVEVTVTAVGNDTADGPRTVTVKGTLGAKDIGSSRDITILDDETTTTAPAIVTDGVQVTSTAATGDTYGLGEPIEITVTFDTAVTVDTSGGTPRIRSVLNGGGTPVDGWAEYSSGSGGTALVFTYTVQAGDMDDDGIWLPANFLQLQGGTISAAADTTVAATLTYAQPGTQSEHKVDGGPTLSTDATLSALALSGVTLDPTFVSATEDYTATVGNAVTETTVTATPTHSGATVAFKDADDNALTNPVTLAVGATVIKAVVTAEDTTTMKTYMVTVTRETTTTSDDATLSALALSGVTLDPTFASATEDYTATVGNAVTETTVTATPTHSGATVAFKDGDDNALTNPVTLAVGANVIKAVVTAEDTTTMKTYMVTVTREATTTTTAPAIITNGVQVTSTSTATADTYGLGETIAITVTFDNAVTVDTSGGTPRIQFRLGPPRDDRWAEYSSGSGGTALVFTYTVLSGDRDDNGIWLPANFLELQSGTILAAADNTVDATLTYAQPGLQTEHKVNGSLTTTDATLSALALSGVTLAPTFVSSTETYTATVGNAVTETTVTATPTHSGATVAFKDGADNALTNPVTLAVGANVIKAVVTAQGTTTMKTYMVTVTRATTTDDVPGAPTSLTATASGTTTINLSWTAPADDGGSAITGYRIEVSPNGTSSWTNRVADTGTTTTTYAHTGLSAGTTRHYRVSAINSVGTGAASSTANATTDNDTNKGPLVLTVEAVKATVTEGEPVRYRIVMSRRTPGAVVQSSFRYKGNFVRNPNSVVTSGINSHGGRLSWVVSYDTLDDVVDEPNGKFTVTIGKPDSTLTGGADLYSHGEEYTVGSPSSATVTILDNDGDGVPPPPSPPIVSAEDARVEEGPGAELVFPVTLDRAPVETARIDWQTIDGANRTGATAGQDYVAASGTLEFRPGQTSKTIRVAVLDDSHDEGNEVMLLYLSGAEHAVIDDALLKGTIENSDPLPRALMGRFGRTAALHVVERVEARMAAPRTVGVEGRVAGRQVRPGMERELALDVLRQLGASAGRPAPGAGGARSGVPMAAAAGSMALGAGLGRPASGALGLAAGPMDGRASPDGGLFDRGLASLGLGGGHLLTGSSVAVTRETRHGGLLSFWSRGARSSFAGREGALRLDGDVRTTMVGADYATGPLIVGVSLAHSRGLGGYTGVDIGEVHSSVTGLYPWLGYTVSDRVSVWGVTGYGTGTLALTPGEAPALTSGLSMGMAAGGMRGDLAESVVAGFGLAFKADALWVGTAIDGVAGPGGNLAATEAAVTRVRTGLEASRGYRFQRGVSLTPSVEVGLRHDGGDAERGTGLDVGAGVIVSDTSTGLAVDVRVRMLLVHQAEGFRERGASVSLSYNPTPSTPLGLTARVAPSWGGQATSGAEALWGRETMAGLAPGAGAHGTRLAAEVGYGLPVSRRFVGTPTFGVGTSESGRDYRLGYRLGALGGAGTTVELGVEAQRRERSRQGGTDHGARARATLRW